MPGASHYDNLLRCKQRHQPFHGNLKHALIAVKAKRGLWQSLAGDWPKTGSSAASHNDCVIHTASKNPCFVEL